ncbi:MAG: thermonuclease family protein [Alphaproteobacteria bacterium]|nr:thermonuclease family protein [Alphaproteobacteria bacterium]
MRRRDQVRRFVSLGGLQAICGLIALLNVNAVLAKPLQKPDCALAIAEQVAIAAVIDGGALKLADGRTLRLAAIQAPMLSHGRANIEDWPLVAEAKQHISSLVLNRTVGLAFGERGTDRHGAVIGYVHLNNTNEWLQSRLVRDGFARVDTGPDTSRCAGMLLALENEARTAARGIWAHPFYRVRAATELDDAIATFQIVEGKIVSAVERRDRVFLNFGTDYRTDFTVTVAPRNAKRMAKNGTDPLSWGAKRVRVRGWISLLHGPEMELTHPEQLEILQ